LEGQKNPKEIELADIKQQIEEKNGQIKCVNDKKDDYRLAYKLISGGTGIDCVSCPDINVDEKIHKCFKEGIEAFLEKESTSTNEAAVAAVNGKIEELFESCIRGEGIPPADIETVKQAANAFTCIDKSGITVAENMQKAGEDILGLIKSHYETAAAKARKLEGEKDELAKQEEPLTQEIDTLDSQIEGKSEQLKEKKKEREREQEKRKKAILEILDGLRPQVILTVDKKDPRPTAECVLSELEDILEEARTNTASVSGGGASEPSGGGTGTKSPEKENTKPDEPEDAGACQGDKTDPIDDTIAVLNAYPIPMRSPIAKDAESESQKQVLDHVIAALRYEHIKVVSEFGSDSQRAKDIEAALAVAYAQRSDMVYIRPSSAYLRSSYPSTSLQDDPGLAWQNMLRRHMWRASFGDILPAGGARKRQAMARAEIDKQFWQNINSVRVAGGGRTNYVVAKDDIGNWYVKRYSADPTDIIESAKNLALFNLGGVMDADLLSRLKAETEKAQGKKDIDIARSTLEQLFDKYESGYVKQTEDHLKDVKAIFEKNGSLKSRIENAWTTNTHTKDQKEYLGKLKGALDESSKDYLESAYKELTGEGKDMDAHKWGDRIVDALQAVKRFHSDLSVRIGGIRPSEGLKESLPAKQVEVSEQKRNVADAEGKLETAKQAKEDAEQKQLGLVDSPDSTKEQRTEAERLVREKRKEFDLAQDNLTAAQDDLKKAQGELDTLLSDIKKAELAEEVAPAEARRIAKDALTTLLNKRKSAVDEYVTAIMFIEEAIMNQGG